MFVTIKKQNIIKEDKTMYELLKKDGRAKRGRLHTVHGVIETPVFMNVGTIAAIKGAVSTADAESIFGRILIQLRGYTVTGYVLGEFPFAEREYQ